MLMSHKKDRSLPVFILSEFNLSYIETSPTILDFPVARRFCHTYLSRQLRDSSALTLKFSSEVIDVCAVQLNVWKMIPVYNKKSCAAFHSRRESIIGESLTSFPEENTTMPYSGFEPEPTRLQAEGHIHHTGCVAHILFCLKIKA
ncbi:hypothetical protein TNCV_696681 [Trichonephila clavipes]|nr:hypothetical protein TNCV_696681 [Trichonephila clavipes]